jgi:large subunit ribosomal protein L2
VPAKVAHIEYDPNRTARIALLHYADGAKRYIIAPEGLVQGRPSRPVKVPTSSRATTCRCATSPSAPWCTPVELRPGGGAKMGRSAGARIQLVAREGRHATLRLPSGEMRMVDVRCRATVGEVGNAEQSNINWGKAGRTAGRASARPSAVWS